MEPDNKRIFYFEGGGAKITTWPHHFLKNFLFILSRRNPFLDLASFSHHDFFGRFEKCPRRFFIKSFFFCIYSFFNFNIFWLKNLLRLCTRSSSFTQISPINIHRHTALLGKNKMDWSTFDYSETISEEQVHSGICCPFST